MPHPGISIAACLSVAVLVLTCGLTGCGGDGSNPNDVTVVIADELGMLHTVRSASELDELLDDDAPAGKPGFESPLSIDTLLEAEPLDVWPFELAIPNSPRQPVTSASPSLR